MQNINYNLFSTWRRVYMKYGELNNLLSIVIGISIIIIGSFIAYTSQKNIFRRKRK
jgi:hypothetical protein